MASGALQLMRCLHHEFLPTADKHSFKSIRPRKSDDPGGRNKIFYPCYRVVDKVCIQAMEIQYDRFRGSFCVNLGIHYRFLPMHWNDELPVAGKIDAVECIFTKRLTPQGRGDFWWHVSTSETETLASVLEFIEVFDRCGIPFFKENGRLPGSIATITIDDLDNGGYQEKIPDRTKRSPAFIAAIIAYISKHLQRTEDTKAFAAYALSMCDARFRDRIDRFLRFL